MPTFSKKSPHKGLVTALASVMLVSPSQTQARLYLELGVPMSRAVQLLLGSYRGFLVKWTEDFRCCIYEMHP